MRSFFSTIVDLLWTPSSHWGALHVPMPKAETHSEGWAWIHESVASNQSTPFRSLMDDGGINPATGLPMVGGLDVAGNPFGVDLHSSTTDGGIFGSTGCGTSFGSCDAFGSHDSFSSHDSFGGHDAFGSGFGSSWD